MIDQALQKLIEWLQTASPAMWHILTKQIYSEAISMSLIALVLLIIIIVLFGIVKHNGKLKKREQELRDTLHNTDYYDMVIAFSYGCIILCSFFFAVVFIQTVQYLYNPEFYAIKWLISSLSGSGG